MAESAYFIAVGRNDAKRLFATKDPRALRELCSEWIGADSLHAADKILRLGTEWAQLRQRLGPISDESPTAVTAMFAGSHKLVEEEDFTLSVIRPDLIPIMAHTLAKLVGEEAAGNEPALDQFQKFFAAAAENRDAVAVVRLAAEDSS